MKWTLCLWEHHVSERKAHPHLGPSSKSRISNLISSKPNNQNLLALPLASENFRLILFSEDRIESLPKQGPDENKYSGPSMVPGVPNESENALATYFDVAVIRCLFISHWSEDGVFWALMFLTRRWVSTTGESEVFLIDYYSNLFFFSRQIDVIDVVVPSAIAHNPGKKCYM